MNLHSAAVTTFNGIVAEGELRAKQGLTKNSLNVLRSFEMRSQEGLVKALMVDSTITPVVLDLAEAATNIVLGTLLLG